MIDLITRAAWEMAGFAILGALLYCVDRTVGVRLYHRIYALTHREPLPREVDLGALFLYSRTTRTRLSAAAIISIVANLVLIFFHHSDWLFNVVMMFLEGAAILVGTWFGPPLYRLWQMRHRMFSFADKVGTGEIDPIAKAKEEAGHLVEAVVAPVRAGVAEVTADLSALTGSAKKEVVPEVVVPPLVEVVPEPPQESARERIRRLTQR